MNAKQQEAQRLYFTGSYSQKQVAEMVGVSERSIYNWIKQHAWDALRNAALRAPALIAENLASQIVELQDVVAAREPGQRFPTAAEAEITRKLIMCYDKMKNYPSLSQSTQVLQSFSNFVKDRAPKEDTIRDVTTWASIFLQANAKNGYRPHQLEYGGAAISPFDFFDGNVPGESLSGVRQDTAPAAAQQKPGTPLPAEQGLSQMPGPATRQVPLPSPGILLQKPEIPLPQSEAILPPHASAAPITDHEIYAEIPLKKPETPLQKPEANLPGNEGRAPRSEVQPSAEVSSQTSENSLQKPETISQQQKVPARLPGGQSVPGFNARREQMKQIREELMARYNPPNR